MDVLNALWLFGVCVAAATLGVLAATLLQARLLTPSGPQLIEDPGQAIFLFDGENLLDASAGARLLLAGTSGGTTDFARFLLWAEPRFEGLRDELSGLPSLGALRTVSDGLTLLAEWRSGLMRITIQEPHLDPPFRSLDQLSELTREQELRRLRLLMEEAPLPIWSEDAAHRILWANRAYVALTGRGAEDTPLWPLPRVFGAIEGGGRVVLRSGSQEQWFECHVTHFEALHSYYAMPAQALVEAERTLAEVLRTMAHTFSYLPVGLAMFDRERRLTLFNPALSDLTRLAPAFLSGRPGLNAFLDALRERGMIPEPSDYQAWRARIVALEAEGGPVDFEEIWTLQAGVTHRVAIRPHAEGGMVLLMQDISEEIAGTRRLKAELELGQSVLDAGEEAVAVFSTTGQLVMTNRPYRMLWGEDLSQSLHSLPATELIETWRAASGPTPFWDEVAAFVAGSGSREPRSAKLRLVDGRSVAVRLAALSDGASLLAFRPDPPGPPQLSGLLRSAPSGEGSLPPSLSAREQAG